MATPARLFVFTILLAVTISALGVLPRRFHHHRHRHHCATDTCTKLEKRYVKTCEQRCSKLKEQLVENGCNTNSCTINGNRCVSGDFNCTQGEGNCPDSDQQCCSPVNPGLSCQDGQGQACTPLDQCTGSDPKQTVLADIGDCGDGLVCCKTELVLPDVCNAPHVLLDEIERSSNVGGNLCDNDTVPAVYRLMQDGANAVMDTTCPPSNTCGTQNPVWLNLFGRLLPGPGKSIRVFVNVNVLGNCFANHWPVTETNCGDFTVYNMTGGLSDLGSQCPRAICAVVPFST